MAGYDQNWPADNLTISEIPGAIREKGRQLQEDQIVNAGQLQGYTPGNASGQIPVANGTVCINLNADKLQGKVPTDFAPASHAHPVATASSNGFMSNTDFQKLAGIQPGAEVNQNAFAHILVGSTTIQADGKTDTLEIVAGTGITLTPDAANDRLTIAAHSNENDPTPDEKAALAGTSGTPSVLNKYVTDTDPRLTNARTPLPHKFTHASVGSDPITPADIGAVPAADVVASPTPDKILKLDGTGKVDATAIPLGRGISITNGSLTIGCRLTLGATAPANPVSGQEIWFDTGNNLIKYYSVGTWVAFGAVAL